MNDTEPTEREDELIALVNELVAQRDALTTKVAHFSALLGRATRRIETLEAAK